MAAINPNNRPSDVYYKEKAKSELEVVRYAALGALVLSLVAGIAFATVMSSKAGGLGKLWGQTSGKIGLIVPTGIALISTALFIDSFYSGCGKRKRDYLQMTDPEPVSATGPVSMPPDRPLTPPGREPSSPLREERASEESAKRDAKI